ncbi:MAG: Rab family GTPase [Candidatus Hermodarchaeota archaeon]
MSIVINYDFTWKIMMLGEADAGKTALTIRYISGFFLDDLKLTIGVDFYSKTTNHRGRKVKLQIWDFGGEERFRFLLHQYCKGSNAAFFLYNITNPNSLDILPEWIQVIRENAGDIPIILVGTQAHLNKKRAITREQAIEVARSHNLSAFLEVSAKTGQNVERLFEVITNLLFTRYSVSTPYIAPKKIYPTFKVNKYLSLQLQGGETVIYVKGKVFKQCKYLLLDIPIDGTKDYGEIDSIDEAAEKLQTPWQMRDKYNLEITPKTEFWAHCSNLQAWHKYNYDTRVLHRNLAFPLLKTLADAGDRKAKKVFKDEIALRLESGYPSVVLYLVQQGYLEYLDDLELNTILENPTFLKNLQKSTLNKLPRSLADKIKKNFVNMS